MFLAELPLFGVSPFRYFPVDSPEKEAAVTGNARFVKVMMPKSSTIINATVLLSIGDK